MTTKLILSLRIADCLIDRVGCVVSVLFRRVCCARGGVALCTKLAKNNSFAIYTVGHLSTAPPPGESSQQPTRLYRAFAFKRTPAKVVQKLALFNKQAVFKWYNNVNTTNSTHFNVKSPSVHSSPKPHL